MIDFRCQIVPNDGWVNFQITQPINNTPLSLGVIYDDTVFSLAAGLDRIIKPPVILEVTLVIARVTYAMIWQINSLALPQSYLATIGNSNVYISTHGDVMPLGNWKLEKTTSGFRNVPANGKPYLPGLRSWDKSVSGIELIQDENGKTDTLLELGQSCDQLTPEWKPFLVEQAERLESLAKAYRVMAEFVKNGNDTK